MGKHDKSRDRLRMKLAISILRCLATLFTALTALIHLMMDD